MKLIRLLTSVIALSLAFGATAVSAGAAPGIAQQAKKTCKAKKGKAKQSCIKATTKRLQAQAKRERQRELQNPADY